MTDMPEITTDCCEPGYESNSTEVVMPGGQVVDLGGDSRGEVSRRLEARARVCPDDGIDQHRESRSIETK